MNAARLLFLSNIFVRPNITKNEEKAPKQLKIIFLNHQNIFHPE
jgi:hypothetical protein